MSTFPTHGTLAGLADGVILASAIAGAGGAQPKIIPNDPYFRYQVSFENPGGRLAIPIFSFKPSEVIYETRADLDHNLPRAWALTTGSKQTIAALLDDDAWKRSGFCSRAQGDCRVFRAGLPAVGWWTTYAAVRLALKQ